MHNAGVKYSCQKELSPNLSFSSSRCRITHSGGTSACAPEALAATLAAEIIAVAAGLVDVTGAALVGADAGDALFAAVGASTTAYLAACAFPTLFSGFAGEDEAHPMLLLSAHVL